MFALAIALSLFALAILLPLTTSLRLLRVNRELEELRERVASLEALVRRAAGAATAPAPPPARGSAELGVGTLSPAPLARDAADVAAPASPVRPAVAAPPREAESSAAYAVSPDVASPAAVPLGFEPQTAPSATADAPRTPDEPLDLEGRIGGRWLLYTGVLVLLLGVSFFLKYAFDNQWINETGRVVAGGFAGVALIAGGWRLAARALTTFGQALMGAGLATLYLSIYAAQSFYALIGNASAFVLMLAVTITAAALADRQRSQALAFIAVGGGFLTPFLVGGGQDAQLTLFTYVALLIAGTMVLAQRHDWHALNVLSYAFTFLTVLAWGAAHYRAILWLRTLLFLTLYCVMFVQIMGATGRARTDAARTAAAILATAPVFYHIAAVVLTADHPPAIHIYLIAFTAVGLWLTADPHRSATRLLVLAGGYLPLFGTLTLPDGISWTMANTVTIAAVAALHLLALLDRVFRQEETLDRPELLALHVVAIGGYALLYTTLARAYPQMRGGLAAVLAMGAIVLWRQVQPRDRAAALNACAVAFTLAAIAVAVQFDGPAAIVGWAAEGAAAVWVGLRMSSLWLQLGGLALWGLAAAQMTEGYFDTPAGFTAIVNVRAATTAFVVALAYVLSWMFEKHRDTRPDADRARAALHIVASALTMLWITAEVGSYWEVRFETPQAYLYEQLNLSLAWGIYGALLIVVGMRRGYAPGRYIGITVLAVTIVKVFFFDLWELGGIYRVIGFIAFGVLLVAVSYLYQQRKRR